MVWCTKYLRQPSQKVSVFSAKRQKKEQFSNIRKVEPPAISPGINGQPLVTPRSFCYLFFILFFSKVRLQICNCIFVQVYFKWYGHWRGTKKKRKKLMGPGDTIHLDESKDDNGRTQDSRQNGLSSSLLGIGIMAKHTMSREANFIGILLLPSTLFREHSFF